MGATTRSAYVREMAAEEYHADRTHLSASVLSVFLRSPAEYYERFVSGRMSAPPQTEAQRIGTATHAAILEPERLPQLVAMIPDNVLSKSGARSGEAWKDWSASQGSRALVKRDEWDAIERMISEVWAHPYAGEILSRATSREQNVFWTDGADNQRKARFDAASEPDCLVCDLKTARDPGPNWWRAVRDYGVHRQSAWYRQAYAALHDDVPMIAHIVVGSEPPHEVYVWTLPEAAIRKGEAEIADGLGRLADCLAGVSSWRNDTAAELPIPRFFYEG